jgi:hypothetical protein
VRLDHRNPPGAVDGIAHHFAITRLENVERKLGTRKEDRAWKRKERDSKDSAHVKRTAESRRR